MQLDYQSLDPIDYHLRCIHADYELGDIPDKPLVDVQAAPQNVDAHVVVAEILSQL